MGKKTVQDLVLQKLDNLENKIDMLVATIIPGIKTDLEIAKVKASNSVKITTAIGGAITLAISLIAAHWMK